MSRLAVIRWASCTHVAGRNIFSALGNMPPDTYTVMQDVLGDVGATWKTCFMSGHAGSLLQMACEDAPHDAARRQLAADAAFRLCTCAHAAFMHDYIHGLACDPANVDALAFYLHHHPSLIFVPRLMQSLLPIFSHPRYFLLLHDDADRLRMCLQDIEALPTHQQLCAFQRLAPSLRYSVTEQDADSDGDYGWEAPVQAAAAAAATQVYAEYYLTVSEFRDAQVTHRTITFDPAVGDDFWGKLMCSA